MMKVTVNKNQRDLAVSTAQSTDVIHSLRNSITPSILSQYVVRECFSALPIEHMEKAIEELNDHQLPNDRREKLNAFLVASIDQIKIIHERVTIHLDRMEQSAGITEKIIADFESSPSLSKSLKD